jgi:hypothetical protein
MFVRGRGMWGRDGKSGNEDVWVWPRLARIPQGDPPSHLSSCTVSAHPFGLNPWNCYVPIVYPIRLRQIRSPAPQNYRGFGSGWVRNGEGRAEMGSN